MKRTTFAVSLVIYAGVTLAQPKQATPSKPDKATVDSAYQNALVGAMSLKARARDPTRFVLEEALVMDDSLATCYQFRAANGFGGMNRGQAVLTLDRKQFRTNDDPGFTNLYNRICAGKPGKPATAAINGMLR